MTDFELISAAVSCGNGFCTRKCPFYDGDVSTCQQKFIGMLAKKLDIVLHQSNERKIKHGHWGKVFDNGAQMHECSVCGARAVKGVYEYKNPNKYCYHCGAKMDGEDNV